VSYDPVTGEDDDPIAAHAIVLPEQHIVGRRPRAAPPSPTPIDMLLGSAGDAIEHGIDWLMNPTATAEDHPETTWPAAGAAPDAPTATDALTGAVHASGLEGLLANLGDFGSLGPSDTTREGRVKRATFAAQKAEARSPGAYTTGEVAGALAPLLIPGAQEAEGASLLSRLGTTAGEGAAYMGLTSEGDTPEEIATDAALGAGGGLAARGLASGVRAASGRLGRALERTVSEPDTVDLARLSSLLGERRAPITSREMQEMIRTLGAGAPRDQRIGRAADRVREMGVVGPFSTIGDILSRVRERLPQAEARTAAIRQAFTDAGGRVPVEAVPRSLEDAARAIEMDPALAEHAPSLRQQADAASEALWRHADDAQSVPLEPAEAALEPIRQRSQFRSLTDVPSSQEAMREGLRSARSAVDDVVASQLGGDVAREFPAARRDVQALRLAEALAANRAGRAATRSPLASAVEAIGPMVAGGGGGAVMHGGTGALGGAALATGAGMAYRALRAREASMIASGLETIQNLVRSNGYRALGEYGPILERAAARGSLPAVHDLLMRSDPDYASMVESATPPTHDVSSAVQALSEPDAQEQDFDPSMLDEEPFDPSMLE